MVSKRRWWQNTKRNITVGAILAVVLGVLALVLLGYNVNWTGFNGQPAKTLWDWMALLIVPTVLAAGGYLYSRFQDQIGRAKELDNQRETALQTYLDKMSELFLDKDNPLRESKSEDVVRSVAQEGLFRL